MTVSSSDSTAADVVTEPDRLRLPGREAVIGLFSPGGPFEDFPGAVLVAGHNGVVLSANAAAEPIAELLKGGASAELLEALKAALDGKSAQINPLLIEDNLSAPGGRAFDLLLLPWGEGAAALLLGRDITLERSLRNALVDSRQRFKDLVEATCDFAWETDAEGRFCYLSSELPLGHPAAELIGREVEPLLIDADKDARSPFLTRRPIRDVEVWLRAADGAETCMSVTALPLYGPNGDWRGARGVCRNVTDERSFESELAHARNQDRLLSYILSIVRHEMEPANMLVAAAGALLPALPATGVAVYRRVESRGQGPRLVRAAQAGSGLDDESLQAPLAEVLASGHDMQLSRDGGLLLLKPTGCRDGVNGALCLWRADAERRWTAADHALLDEVANQLGLANEQLLRESELQRRSATDPLTGLLNRRGFMDALERRLGRAAGSNSCAALLYIDLDNFKLVNDRFGHQQGDDTLKAIANLLREQVRSADLAARLGGDEFALYLDRVSEDSAGETVRRLARAARRLASASGDPDRPLGLSIGVALHDPRNPLGAEALIELADRHMYESKRRGKRTPHPGTGR